MPVLRADDSRTGSSPTIDAWSCDGVLFESYRYPPGPAGATPRHSHDEYQVCLSLDFPGEYDYRSDMHKVPVGGLSVIHPGEVHATRDPADRPRATSYRVAYLTPDYLCAVVGGRRLPFVSQPIIADAELGGAFLELHRAAECSGSTLEAECRLLSFTAALVARHSDARSSPQRWRSDHAAVDRVLELLHARWNENVALSELSAAAALSPSHLNSIFSRQVGLPPHRYQLQLRVSRARRLLAEGLPIAEVAREAGFSDQSHFARSFRRLMKISPGRYRLDHRKNVQDR